MLFAELDYLTSTNFMDKLDTGVLVCHLARTIQSKAKDVVGRYGDETDGTDQPTPPVLNDEDDEARFQQFCTIYNGNSPPTDSAMSSSAAASMKKHAQQYLQQLLRGANSRETLLAAAKVFSFSLLPNGLFLLVRFFFPSRINALQWRPKADFRTPL